MLPAPLTEYPFRDTIGSDAQLIESGEARGARSFFVGGRGQTGGFVPLISHAQSVSTPRVAAALEPEPPAVPAAAAALERRCAGSGPGDLSAVAPRARPERGAQSPGL